MGKIAFTKNPEAPAAEAVTTVSEVSTPVEGVTIETTTVANAPAPTLAVAVVPPAPVARAQAPMIFDDENIGFDEVILPRINIVQKVGEMSNIWTPGEIVLNQQRAIYTQPVAVNGVITKPGTDPLTIIVLGFQKTRFVEKVSGGAQGAIVDSLEEVQKLNGTLEYREWQEKSKANIPVKLFQRLSTALLLVERPASVDDQDNLLFSYEFQGKFFALALWSMKGTAYTNGAKRMFTDRKLGHLRAGGYSSYTYLLSTKLETYKFTGTENYAHIPVLKPGQRTSPEFQAFVKEVLGIGA